MRGEVRLDAFEERILADPDNELLESRCAFVVGDRVEVERYRLDVRNIGDDRMRGRQLVLGARGRLGRNRELRPRRLETRCLGDSEVAHVLGEALVEPEVVPPGRRDEVSEPHVRHLVQRRFRALHTLRVGHPGAEDHPLVVDHAGHVLHRARREFGHVELVVLAEGVPVTEAALEKVEALARDLEDLVGIEVLSERLPAVEPERDASMVLTHGVVLAGHDGRDVGRHHARFRKCPHARCVSSARSVRNDHPAFRRLDGEGERSLEVGLVEARKAAVRGVLAELAVQVRTRVHWISEPVDPGPIARIGPAALDRQRVLGLQRVEPHPAGLEARERVAVELRGKNRAIELDERARARLATSKSHRRRNFERQVATGEVEPHIVVIDRDDGRPLTRLTARQVVMRLVFRSGKRSTMHRPSRPGFADASVAFCARSVTHLRDALPRVLVGSSAPAAKAAPCRPDSRTEHYVQVPPPSSSGVEAATAGCCATATSAPDLTPVGMLTDQWSVGITML